jgi:carboxypeptidase family protein
MRKPRTNAAGAIIGGALLIAACGEARPDVSPSPLDPRSYAMFGAVTDTAFRPIAGAKVEILEGPQQNMSVVTAADGRFSLTFASTLAVAVRATKEGYTPQTMTVRPSSGVFVSFHLPVPETVNLAGTYTLTFEADAACRDIPEPLRTRTYTATITPSRFRPGNTLFEAMLSGAPLLSPYDGFEIGVAGDFVALSVFNDPDEGEGIVEQVAPDTYLEIVGSATTSVPAGGWSTLSMPFDGYFGYCVNPAPFMSGSLYRCYMRQPRLLAECRSKNHRLTLSRP